MEWDRADGPVCEEQSPSPTKKEQAFEISLVLSEEGNRERASKTMGTEKENSRSSEPIAGPVRTEFDEIDHRCTPDGSASSYDDPFSLLE